MCYTILMIKRVEDLLLNFNGKLRQLPFLTFAPNKKILRLGVFLFLVFFALLTPLHYAYGIPLADFIANAIFLVFFSVFLYIGGYFVRIAIEILNFVLSAQFFRYSLTGLDNPIVNVGWTLVRDLINITFVIILIVIGLATALRYKDYQAKKALPRLIIVALLINFSYIIVGLFVDLANIVMNFFLTKVDGLNNVGAMVTSQSAVIGETLKRGAIILGLIPAIIQVLLIVFFDILAGITILLFAGLFAVRMIIIMILVILSPAAFAAAILPGTQNYFNQWRSTLSQWLLLGIFAAFFLYLGNHMLIEAPTMIFAAPQTTIDYAISDLIVRILPYGISIIFLWLGLFMGFSGAPAVANTVIGFAQGQARALPGRFKSFAAGRAQRTKEDLQRTKLGQKFTKRMEQVSKWSPKTGWGEGEETVPGWFKRRAAGVIRTATEPVRSTARKLGPEVSEEIKNEIEKAEKEVEKASVNMVISKFRSAADWTTKTGYLNRLIKQNDLDEALRKGLTIDKDIAPAYYQAKKFDAHKDLQSALPGFEEAAMMSLAGVAGPRSGMTPAQLSSLAATYGDNLMKKIKPSRAGQISESVLRDDVIMEAIIRTWSGKQVGNLIDTHGIPAMRAIVATIENKARTAGVTGVTNDVWLSDPHYANNPNLLRYLKSSAARSLGITI